MKHHAHATILAIATALMICAALAEANAAQRLEELRPDGKILAFGDSLTSGVGGSGENYPSRLSRLIHHEVINGGNPGETTAQGRARLSELIRSTHPDLLILCLGVNDLLKGVPEARIRSNLYDMLASARSSGVPVLLLALPRPGSPIADPLFAEAAEAGGAVLDDRSMVEVLSNPGLKADLVHPNGDGYRQLAANLEQQLRAVGALPQK